MSGNSLRLISSLLIDGSFVSQKRYLSCLSSWLRWLIVMTVSLVGWLIVMPVSLVALANCYDCLNSIVFVLIVFFYNEYSSLALVVQNIDKKVTPSCHIAPV